jgi:hypothetical protein
MLDYTLGISSAGIRHGLDRVYVECDRTCMAYS